MTQTKLIAGAYLADDFVHWGVGYFNDNRYPTNIMDITTGKFKSRGAPNLDLSDAVESICNSFLPDGKQVNADYIHAFVVASLGPFFSAKAGEKNYGRLAKGMRLSEWDDYPLADNASKYISKYTKNKISVRTLVDAEACALGLNYRRVQKNIRERTQSDQDKMFGKSMVLLLVTEGIGGAIINDNTLVYGEMHTELGHMSIGRHVDDPSTNNDCDGHIGECLEGLASMRSIKSRWNLTAYEWKNISQPDHPLLKLEGFYLAQAISNITMCFTPARIILGGSVMDNPYLLRWIKDNYRAKLRWKERKRIYPGYESQNNLDEFISVIGQKENDKMSIGDIGLLGCMCFSNDTVELGATNNVVQLHSRKTK